MSRKKPSPAPVDAGAADDLMAMAMSVPIPIPALPPEPKPKPKPKAAPKPKSEAKPKAEPEPKPEPKPDMAQEASGVVALPDGDAVRASRTMDRLNLRIQSELKADLETLAKAQGITLSEYVLDLVGRAVDVAEQMSDRQ